MRLASLVAVSSEKKYLGEHDLEDGTPDERIRVAIVSQYFCSHPVGRLALPIIASLPRDKFKVTVFSFPTIVDSWAQAISWSADNYVGLPNDFVKASQKIAASNSDILLYADHSDPISCLLSYQRLAPVQVRNLIWRSEGFVCATKSLKPFFLSVPSKLSSNRVRAPRYNKRIY